MSCKPSRTPCKPIRSHLFCTSCALTTFGFDQSLAPASQPASGLGSWNGKGGSKDKEKERDRDEVRNRAFSLLISCSVFEPCLHCIHPRAATEALGATCAFA